MANQVHGGLEWVIGHYTSREGEQIIQMHHVVLVVGLSIVSATVWVLQ